MAETHAVIAIHHVELTEFAASQIRAIRRQALLEASAKANTVASRQKLLSVTTALQSLETLDATIDKPLSGPLWFVKSIATSTVELFYARFSQPLPLVLVLHVCEFSPDPDGTYRLFAQMVMSGNFNSTFTALGCEIPQEILKSPGSVTFQ